LYDTTNCNTVPIWVLHDLIPFRISLDGATLFVQQKLADDVTVSIAALDLKSAHVLWNISHEVHNGWSIYMSDTWFYFSQSLFYNTNSSFMGTNVTVYQQGQGGRAIPRWSGSGLLYDCDVLGGMVTQSGHFFTGGFFDPGYGCLARVLPTGEVLNQRVPYWHGPTAYSQSQDLVFTCLYTGAGAVTAWHASNLTVAWTYPDFSCDWPSVVLDDKQGVLVSWTYYSLQFVAINIRNGRAMWHFKPTHPLHGQSAFVDFSAGTGNSVVATVLFNGNNNRQLKVFYELNILTGALISTSQADWVNLVVPGVTRFVSQADSFNSSVKVWSTS